MRCIRPSVLAALFVSRVAFGEGCSNWGAAVQEGLLDRKFIDQSAGLAFSQLHDRLYHVNDSTDTTSLYITDRKGGSLRRVELDFQAVDLEDIALSKCPAPSGKDCLYIADIGDNRTKRGQVKIAIFPEPEHEAKLTPIAEVKFTYEDKKPHDSEAFMVHPNGDWYIFTKDQKLRWDPLPSKVFKIGGNELKSGLSTGSTVAKKIGEIDFTQLLGINGWGALVTGAAMRADGKAFSVLTYRRIVEFSFDISALSTVLPALVAQHNYRVISPTVLIQQEAISYGRDSRSLWYTTESAAADGPLMRIPCIN